MKFIATLGLAFALAFASLTPSRALPQAPVVVAATGTTVPAAAWIAGGIVGGMAVSLIACAAIKSAAGKGQLTAREATLAALLPLGCLLP